MKKIHPHMKSYENLMTICTVMSPRKLMILFHLLFVYDNFFSHYSIVLISGCIKAEPGGIS